MRVHRSAEADPADRGRAFGAAQRDAVRNTVAVYRRLLEEAAGATDASLRLAGARVGDRVAERWPDLVRELEGIAEGAGVPADVLVAINARTELLGAQAGGECSVAGRLLGDRCVVAQNWDWHPDLAPSLLVWSVRQPDGRWFATVTEAGMLAKIGVSSAGLCCALNFLRCSLDGALDGVPVHVLLRVLLDRTDTLSDALRLLLGSPVGASSCITLGWADNGDAALVAAELSPGGCRLLWPDAADRLVHTNHFLVGPPAGEDLEPADAPSTLVRLHALNRGLRGGDPLTALRSHAGAPESVCRHERPGEAWADRRATLACVVMEPGAPHLRVGEGPPCERSPVEVALP